jgi:two-component system, LytTR family, response regulator
MSDVKINCLVLDDEQHAIDVLSSHIADTPYLHLVLATTSQQEALKVLANEAVDLIFLDVQMPGVSGLDFIKVLKGNYHVVFYSAHMQYAVDGFENDVVDFLLKPVTYARFLKATQKALKLVKDAHEMVLPEVDEPGYIFVKNGVKGKAVRVSFSDLLYVEAQKNYVIFNQRQGKVITYMSITDAAAKLPAREFLRVHRSFIVRLGSISMVEGNIIRLMDTDATVSIGENYKQQLFDALGIG